MTTHILKIMIGALLVGNGIIDATSAVQAKDPDPRTSATLRVEIHVPDHSRSHGSVQAVHSGDGQGSRLHAQLPDGFVTEATERITVVEPSSGSAALSQQRFFFRDEGGMLQLAAGPPPPVADQPLMLVVEPGWDDRPGAYAAKLVAEDQGSRHEVEILVDVRPFVRCELVEDRLRWSENRGIEGQVAILVTSNARLWELRYRLSDDGLATHCPGIDLEPAQASTRWTIDSGPDGGVIRGRGAVDALRIVLAPEMKGQDNRRPGGGVAVFLLEETSAQ